MKKIIFFALAIILSAVFLINAKNEVVISQSEKNYILKSRKLRSSMNKILTKKDLTQSKRSLASIEETYQSNNQQSRFDNENIRELFRKNYTLMQQKEIAFLLEKEIESDEYYLQSLTQPNEIKQNKFERKKQLLFEMNDTIDSIEMENYHKEDRSNE